jgi:predicted aspartyl protease
MGKVVVNARIENIMDALLAKQGEIPSDQVRTANVTDALVDTGATILLLPSKIISQLGLLQFRTRQARSLAGTVSMPIYSAVRLTVHDRDCTVDVGEISDEFPVIIGQIPLEMMDWVIDARGQKLIGNPEHGGEQIIECF